MSKRIPPECSAENCPQFAKCGKLSTYANHKCRCSACVDANRKYQRQYREANKQKLKEYDALRYRTNERRRETNRLYRERCRAENPQWMQEYFREYHQQLRKERPDILMERCRKRRARVRNATVAAFTADQLAERLSYYGNRCYLRLDGCTGIGDQVEHVKPISKGGAHMLANLRPACKPCNSRKGTQWPFVGGHEMARS
jgi:5-methylcytosine-specific restriction endonuclease McrA